MHRTDGLKFKNNINESKNTQQFQKNKIIQRIMDKYDVSPYEAERIFIEIVKKQKSKGVQDNKKNDNLVYSNKKNSKQVSDKNLDNAIKPKINQEKIPKKTDIIKNSTPNANITKNQGKYNEPINHNADLNQNSDSNSFNSNSKSKSEDKNVDSLLGEIIPDYNQQIAIDVNHVDLTFEVSNEKIDTIKEMFIRTLKRNKSKKIKIHALKDISFQIYKGEKVGIIGYNGAGKSTLLNVITGIFPPDTGSVTTYGNISPLLSLGAGFDHNFSGRKNIILNGAVLGYDKEYLESKVDEIIEFSELGEFIDIPIKNYSSGMMAKLGFSIATALNPDILIIDEILGVGDVNFQKKSADKMRSLMDGGTTVLLVSHSIPQIRELCDKAIWIDHGSLREIGEVNKVCDHYLKDAEKASNEQLANIQFR